MKFLIAILKADLELEKKATPAPWKANGSGGTSDAGSTRQWPCFNGQIIASRRTIIGDHTFLGVQGKTPEEAEANAEELATARNHHRAYAEFAAKVAEWSHREMGRSPIAIREALAELKEALGTSKVDTEKRNCDAKKV